MRVRAPEKACFLRTRKKTHANSRSFVPVSYLSECQIKGEAARSDETKSPSFNVFVQGSDVVRSLIGRWHET